MTVKSVRMFTEPAVPLIKGDIVLATYYEDAHCVLLVNKDIPGELLIDTTNDYAAIRMLEVSGYVTILNVKRVEFFGYSGTVAEGVDNGHGVAIETQPEPEEVEE